VKRFRGGLEFKAHKLVYPSTIGWRVIKKRRSLVRGRTSFLAKMAKKSSHVRFWHATAFSSVSAICSQGLGLRVEGFVFRG